MMLIPAAGHISQFSLLSMGTILPREFMPILLTSVGPPLRVGVAIGSPEVIEALNRVKNSFNSYPIDRLAQVGAIAAFEDEDWFRATCEGVIGERGWVTSKLEALGFDVLPSKANFILARHPDHAGEALAKGLREKGVIVRHFNKPRISDFLRITIGTADQNKRLVECLKPLV